MLAGSIVALALPPETIAFSIMAGVDPCGLWRLHEVLLQASLNRARAPPEPVGNIPPAETEEQYYATAGKIDVAA